MELLQHPKSFKELYTKLSLNDYDGARTLHSNCRFAKECWESAEHRKPKEGSNESQIYYPWIGSNYDKLRLLVLGINMNSHGGMNAAQSLIEKAIQHLGKGKKRLFANKKYRGSMFFYMAARYTAIFAKAKQIPGFTENTCTSDKGVVASSLDFIAYTNQIKCSPDDEKREDAEKLKSKPTIKMWENCSGYILKEELEYLKPNNIFIFGESDNKIYFERRILDSGYTDVKKRNQVSNAKGHINGRPVNIFIFPHPGVPKGINKSLFSDFSQLLEL